MTVLLQMLKRFCREIKSNSLKQEDCIEVCKRPSVDMGLFRKKKAKVSGLESRLTVGSAEVGMTAML